MSTKSHERGVDARRPGRRSSRLACHSAYAVLEALGELGVDGVEALRERLGEDGEAEERPGDVDELEPLDVMACCGARGAGAGSFGDRLLAGRGTRPRPGTRAARDRRSGCAAPRSRARSRRGSPRRGRGGSRGCARAARARRRRRARAARRRARSSSVRICVRSSLEDGGDLRDLLVAPLADEPVEALRALPRARVDRLARATERAARIEVEQPLLRSRSTTGAAGRVARASP